MVITIVSCLPVSAGTRGGGAHLCTWLAASMEGEGLICAHGCGCKHGGGRGSSVHMAGCKHGGGRGFSPESYGSVWLEM